MGFEKKQWISLAFAGIFFFLATSFLAYFNFGLFNSPDEAANYFFIEKFESTSSLQIFEPLNKIAPVVHPRSINVIGDKIVPGGFIGLVLFYGSIAKVIGLKFVLYLTPLLGALAIWPLFWIMRRIFDQKVALGTVGLWVLHPAVLYYSARGLLPNILFVSTLIFSIYFVWRAIEENQKKYSHSILAGLFVALAVSVRPNELVWIVPVDIVLAVALIKYSGRKAFKPVLITSISAIIFILPVLYFQQQTYGGVFNVGYQSFPAEAGAPPSGNFVQPQKLLLPFDFNFQNLKDNFVDYIFVLFWWLSIPAVWGLLWKIRSWKILPSVQRVYLLIGAVMIPILLLYYGSGKFLDSTLREATIGTSYVRYWLPIYIWLLPFAVVCFLWLPSKIKYLLLVIPPIAGLSLAFFTTPESLVPVSKILAANIRLKEVILKETETDSIIITYRTDKVFFPTRRVIHSVPPDPELWPRVARLLKYKPVYFFTMLTEKDMDNLNSNHLSKSGLKALRILEIENFRLYKLLAL